MYLLGTWKGRYAIVGLVSKSRVVRLALCQECELCETNSTVLRYKNEPITNNCIGSCYSHRSLNNFYENWRVDKGCGVGIPNQHHL